MSSKNNYEVFNTSIEDYTINELYNLLELDELTREHILLKVHTLNTNVFNNNEPIKAFFLQAQNKLLNYLTVSDTNLDYYLHNNANANIELNIKEQFTNNNEENEDGEDDDEEDEEEDDEDDKVNIIETYVNYSNSTTNSTTNPNSNSNTNPTTAINSNPTTTINSNPTTAINTNPATAINSINTNPNINSDIIETYYIYKNLYFNTTYRVNKFIANALPTDCKILLNNTLNNVIQCKLTSLNIRKPFLIHNTKSNNSFIIKKYNSTNKVDFSFSVVIENGYYEDSTEMENFINNKFKNTSVNISNISEEILDTSNTKFINALNFSINKNTKISTFDLSKTYINDNSLNNIFKYYEIDFLTNYIPPYSLANILGFNNATYNSANNINGIHNIIGPKTYNTLSSPIYFCFDENQSAIVETHQLFLNNNLSSDKILAKINTYKGSNVTNYYIYEILDNIDNKNNVRQYSGPINLSSFTIKIIDNYGLLVQSIQEEFTFDLEIIIQATKLVNK